MSFAISESDDATAAAVAARTFATPSVGFVDGAAAGMTLHPETRMPRQIKASTRLVFDDNMILPLLVFGGRENQPGPSRRYCLAMAVDPRSSPAKAGYFGFFFCIEKTQNTRRLN